MNLIAKFALVFMALQASANPSPANVAFSDINGDGLDDIIMVEYPQNDFDLDADDVAADWSFDLVVLFNEGEGEYEAHRLSKVIWADVNNWRVPTIEVTQTDRFKITYSFGGDSYRDITLNFAWRNGELMLMGKIYVSEPRFNFDQPYSCDDNFLTGVRHFIDGDDEMVVQKTIKGAIPFIKVDNVDLYDCMRDE